MHVYVTFRDSLLAACITMDHTAANCMYSFHVKE